MSQTAPCLPPKISQYALFSISLGTGVILRRNEKQKTCKTGGGEGRGASNLCYGRSACKWRIVEKNGNQNLYTKRPPLLSSQRWKGGNDWLCRTSGAGPVVCLFQNKVMFLLRTCSHAERRPTESFKGSFLGTEGRDMVTQRQWILAKPFFLNGPIKLRRCVSFAINQKVSFYIRLAMWCLIKN